MKFIMKMTKIISTLLFSAFFVLSLNNCSDEKTPETTQNIFDHSHDATVTDLVKHKFEHEFAEQCIERETRNSNNKANDRKRFEKPCLCIATYMMKDLTAVEAEKFLQEQKDTQSLRIRFENAAYHCLQEKNKKANKSPVVFKLR